jgi:hypothetical protein
LERQPNSLMLLGACIGALIPRARQAFARGGERIWLGETVVEFVGRR